MMKPIDDSATMRGLLYYLMTKVSETISSDKDLKGVRFVLALERVGHPAAFACSTYGPEETIRLLRDVVGEMEKAPASLEDLFDQATAMLEGKNEPRN